MFTEISPKRKLITWLWKLGGQKPLEASRFGCNILNGPYIANFKEIYKFLEQNNISQTITSHKDLTKKLNRLFKNNNKTNKMDLKLKLLGRKVLKETFKEINIY